MASKQESLHDYYQMSKEIAKIEKNLDIERWVKIAVLYKHEGSETMLYHYDLPVWQYRKWEWVIRWRQAKLQCQHPRECVTLAFDYYKKVMGCNIGMQQDIDKFVAAKAQVTKQERIITAYVADQKKSNLFFNEETDEQLNKVKAKLQSKKEIVALAEQRLIDKVKDYQSMIAKQNAFSAKNSTNDAHQNPNSKNRNDE